ncbi:hypothetical protein ABK040_007947 [Willaertia magna]
MEDDDFVLKLTAEDLHDDDSSSSEEDNNNNNYTCNNNNNSVKSNNNTFTKKTFNHFISSLEDKENELTTITTPTSSTIKPTTITFTNNTNTNNNNLNTNINNNNIVNNNIPIKSYPTPIYNPDSPSAKCKFQSLCKTFEKLMTINKHKEKKEILDKIFTNCKSDLFQFMRLLLPQLDKERLTYGLKESKIAKYYIELLALPITCTDAQRLRKWKDPSRGSGNSFSDICFQVLQKRGWSSTKNLSIFEINEKLTQLATAIDNEQKKKVLLDLLKTTSSFEQKWLLRIILKDLRIGIQHTTILNNFHPNAVELFNSCTDLREVIDKCLDPTFKFTIAELKLFSAFKPMLASLLHIGKFANTLKEGEFVIEPKFDGERILIHKRDSEVKFFTRNGKDYTALYGNKFTSTILKQVKAKSCILDGEMLVWNKELEAFKEFGHNRTFALSDDNNNNCEQFCYMVFDVVYLKDKDLTQLPLRKRRKYLIEIIKEEPHALEIVKQTSISTEKEVYEQLDLAIMNRDEGIMIKNLDSNYVPGERKWQKLKPDHVDGFGETLDLIIVGGYYGTKFNRKSVSHFLLAVATKSKHSMNSNNNSNSGEDNQGYDFLEDELLSNDENQVFHTFCKVGSGYTNSELLTLQKELQPHWKTFDRNKIPKHFGDWIPGAGEVPDVYINPKKLLEIKGYSFQDSTKFKTGVTLRFPRVVSIRYDKDWNDCLDLKGMEEMIELSKSGNLKRKVSNLDNVMSNGQLKKNKRSKAKQLQQFGSTTSDDLMGVDSGLDGIEGNNRKKKITSAVLHCFDHDMSHFEKQSELFKGYEFVVFNGDDKYSKYEIEKLITIHGGIKVQNPSDKANQYLIAAHSNNITVKNWINSSKECKNPLGDKDIIHYKWIQESILQKKMQRLYPGVMIYTSKKTSTTFKEQMDEYEDEFLHDATIESLINTLNIAKNSSKYICPELYHIEQIDSRYNISVAKNYFFLRSLKVYIDKYEEIGNLSSNLLTGYETIEMWIEIYGGSICDNMNDKNITHILVDEEELDRIQEMKRIYSVVKKRQVVPIVKFSWIRECISQRKIVNVQDYLC